MRDTIRKRKLRALLAEHPARDNPAFVDLLGSIADSRPNDSANSVFQTAVYCWELAEAIRAGQQEHDRAVRLAERERIAAIVAPSKTPDELRAAVSLALTTDHAPDVALAMLERQRAQSLS